MAESNGCSSCSWGRGHFFMFIFTPPFMFWGFLTHWQFDTGDGDTLLTSLPCVIWSLCCIWSPSILLVTSVTLIILNNICTAVITRTKRFDADNALRLVEDQTMIIKTEPTVWNECRFSLNHFVVFVWVVWSSCLLCYQIFLWFVVSIHSAQSYCVWKIDCGQSSIIFIHVLQNTENKLSSVLKSWCPLDSMINIRK